MTIRRDDPLTAPERELLRQGARWPDATAAKVTGQRSGAIFEAARDGAMDSMVRAARCYDESRGALWQTYALTGMRRGATWAAAKAKDRRRMVDMPEGIAGGENPAKAAERRETCSLLLRGLPERYARIVRMRFYDGMTLTEIARLEGVTTQRISIIAVEALKCMRIAFNRGVD